MYLGEMKKHKPPLLPAHIQLVELARTRWTMAGAQRTPACTTGNGAQPGLQQKSLKGGKKKKNFKKKQSCFFGTCSKKSFCPPES